MQNATSLESTSLDVRPVTKGVALWSLFFFVVYLILLIKAISFQYITDHVFFGIYSFIVTSYILSRFILAYFHKSVPIDYDYLPTVSFVVPAKNEGDNIRKTLMQFGDTNYPYQKMEVIAINDGSDDNTLNEMQAARDILAPKFKRFLVIDWKQNRGKREGMAEGVKLAKGEIVVFVDSDSFIDKDCVRNLVKYFKDESVGAVSGHTDVYNYDTNLLTRMQSVRYYISFKVYKAAESVFGMVTCCPGCCSAYRRKYLNEFIDEWLDQKFLGKKCTFGDDRSLTNFVIRKYKALYSPEAKAVTVVPDTFRKYMKQQQRWKKSWVRETLIASSFIWKRSPGAAVFFYSYVFLALISPVVFFRAMFIEPIMQGSFPYVYLTGLLLMLVLHGIYYRIEVGDKKWIPAVGAFWFTTVILIWQLPWAGFTISDTRWGTR